MNEGATCKILNFGCSTFVVVSTLADGLFRELNPGPLAPEARIMPLDQTANDYLCQNALTHERWKDVLATSG